MPKWNILGRSALNPSINLNISVLVFSLTKENCPLIVMNFILKHIKCLTCGWHYYYLQHQHSQATALLKMYLKNHISQAENIFEKQWKFSPIKLLEENTGKTFSDINHNNVFLGQSPKATEIKPEVNNWNLIKLIRICIEKENINRMKKQPMDLEIIFANNETNKALISKIYKSSYNSITKKKKTTQSKNGQKI